MDALLKSALELTFLGMGMTFLSIGALTLGMYVMTAIFRGKDRAVVPELDRDEVVDADVAVQYRDTAVDANGDAAEADRRATAAAVAVALALLDMQLDGAVASAHIAPVVVEDAWNAFARGSHLLRRACYDARRFRG